MYPISSISFNQTASTATAIAALLALCQMVPAASDLLASHPVPGIIINQNESSGHSFLERDSMFTERLARQAEAVFNSLGASQVELDAEFYPALYSDRSEMYVLL